MPQTISSETPSHSDDLTKQCHQHNIEMIKFYCQDHKTLLYSICVTLEHTECNVDNIPDVSGKVINSKEYQDILKAIEDMTKHVNKTIEDKKKMNDKSHVFDEITERNKGIPNKNQPKIR